MIKLKWGKQLTKTQEWTDWMQWTAEGAVSLNSSYECIISSQWYLRSLLPVFLSHNDVFFTTLSERQQLGRQISTRSLELDWGKHTHIS
jgi:hypothetical protein